MGMEGEKHKFSKLLSEVEEVGLDRVSSFLPKLRTMVGILLAPDRAVYLLGKEGKDAVAQFFNVVGSAAGRAANKMDEVIKNAATKTAEISKHATLYGYKITVAPINKTHTKLLEFGIRKENAEIARINEEIQKMADWVQEQYEMYKAGLSTAKKSKEKRIKAREALRV